MSASPYVVVDADTVAGFDRPGLGMGGEHKAHQWGGRSHERLRPIGCSCWISFERTVTLGMLF